MTNIRYNLSKFLRKNLVTQDVLDGYFNQCKYELRDELDTLWIPNIKSPMETIEHLLATKNSFCRFGDGEFNLMLGKPQGRAQKYEKGLEDRLKYIFKSTDENIMIGAPYSFYHSMRVLRPLVQKFMIGWVSDNRKNIESFMNKDKMYFATEVSQMYANYQFYDFDEHFDKLREIWNDRDITIICGDRSFAKIQYNIYNNAKTIEYIYGPTRDAFSSYKQMLGKALEIPKERLVIIMLGPTGKLLAYALATEVGKYQVLDFGHLAKDYNEYKKQIVMNDENISLFYNPD
ncbi:hypothetical protein AGMMS49944_25840 [Spirochaetia bacterium]|nr:hypothetical protein AGMMS49944_25840 [Spirochaetia bacterium]